MEKSKELQTSIYFLELILRSSEDTITPQAISELYEIKQGNKKIILEHLKAITSIMNKAIKELEENNGN